MLYGLASQYYGITSLHPFQLAGSEKAIQGIDSIIIQPTGRGKSLCYQLVALQSKKMVFIFTPTVALMYDQVQQLRARGITANALGDEWDGIDDLLGHKYGEPHLVYLTAEYLYGPSGDCSRRAKLLQTLVEDGKVSLIAIDEAHLLFDWEHFRYRNKYKMFINRIGY